MPAWCRMLATGLGVPTWPPSQLAAIACCMPASFLLLLHSSHALLTPASVLRSAGAVPIQHAHHRLRAAVGPGEGLI